jgi:glycosyltransferase involved in cell wall biosynthesis
VRVLFDARPGRSPTGIGRYARTLSALLGDGVPGHACWSLGGDDRLTLRSTTPLEEEFELPALLEREAVDLFHSPLFHVPAACPARAIVTIHDAIPAVHPELTSPEFARVFAGAAEAARVADLVLTPSESAKRDLTERVGVPPEKIRVLLEAPAACFRVLSEDERRQFAPEIDRPYALIVGSLEQRKNPVVVLDALRLLGREDDDILAVFVGPEAGFDLAREANVRGVAERVRYLGRVPDEVLVGLYNGARVLLFPSLYEGFGLPLVEAFACGTPVIASKAASIPEVAGDAALLFEPTNASALAESLRRVLHSPDLQAELRQRGTERLRRFSREAIREQLATLYDALEGRRA